MIWSFARVTPKGGKNKLCNIIKSTKGALNANINVCTVVSLKMLSIIKIDKSYFKINQSKIPKAELYKL